MLRKFLFFIIALLFLNNYNFSAEAKENIGKIGDKDITESKDLLISFLNDYLTNYIVKGFKFKKYCHDEFESLGSDEMELIVVDNNFKMVNTKKGKNDEITISIEFNQIAKVSFTKCDISNKKIVFNYILKKQNGKGLLYRIPEETIVFLEPAIEMTKKYMNEIERGKEQVEGYKKMYDCLKGISDAMNKK